MAMCTENMAGEAACKMRVLYVSLWGINWWKRTDGGDEVRHSEKTDSGKKEENCSRPLK